MHISIEENLNNVITSSQKEISEQGLDVFKANEYLILGQLVSNVLLSHIIFANICQENKQIGRLKRCIPIDRIFQSFICLSFDNLHFWSSDTFGISEKIRITYKIIGYIYLSSGYDKLYSTFSNAVLDEIIAIAKLPINDYFHIVHSHMWTFFHRNFSCKVEQVAFYSEQDQLFRASSTLSGKVYSEIGQSKKQAVENISKNIALDIIGDDKLQEISEKSGDTSIIAQPFYIGETDYKESNEGILKLHSLLNIDCSFLRFSLLSRSQMGGQVWTKAEIPNPDFLDSANASRFKRGLINFGELVLLLEAFEYNLTCGTLKSIDLSVFDITIQNIGKADIQAQLHKMFRSRQLATYLFACLNIPHSEKLTDNDSYQIAENIIASFFISNFAPNKCFQRIFKPMLEEFYRSGLEFEIDYRFAFLTFLSSLNLRPEFSGKEEPNGQYTAEIVLGKDVDALIFSCHNESMREAKRLVWEKAYKSTVVNLQNLFSGRTAYIPKNVLTFMVDRICEASSAAVRSIGQTFYVLDAQSILAIGFDAYLIIIKNIQYELDDGLKFSNLMGKIVEINKTYFVQVEGNIYSFPDAITFAHDIRTERTNNIKKYNDQIDSIYLNILNPNEEIQKKIISYDYRLVKLIYPISFATAKFAIDQNLDAYNFIQTPDEEVAKYYEKALEKFEQLQPSNFGQLICNTDETCKIIILDSHRLVSDQLQELTDSLQIKKATIACGYCFKSGLTLLKQIISRTVYSNVPVQLVIGSLQKYNACLAANSTITGIDKATVRELNQYLVNKNVKVFTCEERFYHGKLYIFEGDKETIICMGSSNVSKSAYASNYELNIAFVVSNDSRLKEQFDLWMKQLVQFSTRIETLEETVFGDNEITEGSVVIKHLSKINVQHRIDELSNVEVQYRLNLWMSHSPDVIAENLGVVSLENYIVFVYDKQKLIVLESFTAGNAYFCLHFNESFESEINKISMLSKTELFEYSQMTKRGYHVTNKFTLESNIRSYFR